MIAATAGMDRRLTNAQSADEPAVDQLMPVVYEQLRRLAKRHLAGHRRGHTLQTTDLLNEAYLKLAHRRGAEWEDRPHFFAVAPPGKRCVPLAYVPGGGPAQAAGEPIPVCV